MGWHRSRGVTLALLFALPTLAFAESEKEAAVLLDAGVALFKAGSLEAAREAFEKARAYAPEKANPYRWLGMTDARLGRCAEAVDELETFLEKVAADDRRRPEALTIRDSCRQRVPAPISPEKAGEWVALKDTTIDLKQRVQFLTGKATIRTESQPVVGALALVLREHPELTRLSIEAHMDWPPSAAAHAASIALSQLRAEAVRGQLIQLGIEASRLVAKGMGPDWPVATNATPEGRAANQRVEIKILSRQ